jgi:hypothetical protein
MIDREQYTPGPARGAQVRKDGEKWTLILARELRHSPEKVWQALTDEAMKFSGWQRLNAEYSKQLGIETRNKPPQAAQKP